MGTPRFVAAILGLSAGFAVACRTPTIDIPAPTRIGDVGGVHRPPNELRGSESFVLVPDEEGIFSTIYVEPGFSPDPRIESGRAGGPTNVRDRMPGCVGHITERPSHYLVLMGPFANLRVAAHSSIDLTLVVQQPNGSYACNDDHEELHPLVSSLQQPGIYRVWVGTYQAGSTGDYRIGVSTRADFQPSQLLP